MEENAYEYGEYGVVSACDAANDDPHCCQPDSQCGLGEGDCDDDDDCSGDLVCGTNNCRGGHSSMDCCAGFRSGMCRNGYDWGWWSWSYECYRGMIETEGKLAFCKLFLEDLKELKKKTWSTQDRKKMFTKEMKQYCFHRNSAKDRKFLASFDKLIRKEKKKMDKKYAKNNDYLKLNMDDKLFNRLNLNDTDFLMSVKVFLSNKLQVRPTDKIQLCIICTSIVIVCRLQSLLQQLGLLHLLQPLQ